MELSWQGVAQAAQHSRAWLYYRWQVLSQWWPFLARLTCLHGFSEKTGFKINKSKYGTHILNGRLPGVA
jgi:hypothetical protein